MGYRPTGKAAGRPRGPVTPQGKLAKARKELPHVRAFPEMARAVDRALAEPNTVVRRDWMTNAKDVDLIHTYTPKERGQILAFVWWVYVNRSTWSRTKLSAAITSVSPLMMFSSKFFVEMTGIPQSTATNKMIRSADMKVTRVTGSCDPWVIHQMLSAAAQGHDEFRHCVRRLSVEKGVPQALLCRLSGIPVSILNRTERGIQFFPEAYDWHAMKIGTIESIKAYRKNNKAHARKHDPRPGDQRTVRDSIPRTPLGEIRATSTPVPDEGELPYHLCIPGLPRLAKNQKPDQKYHDKVIDWESAYHLPATASMGS